VYLAYESFDCEMESFRWYAVFERRAIDNFAEHQRIDFGAFGTLKIAQHACETHAQSVKPELWN
jgi:hypothetical protein